MMVKRKKTVIAAICMAVASVGFVAEANASAPPQETQETSAPDLQNFHLAEIVVMGNVILPVNMYALPVILVF